MVSDRVGGEISCKASVENDIYGGEKGSGN